MSGTRFVEDPKCYLDLIDIVDLSGETKADYVECTVSRSKWFSGVFLAVMIVVIILMLFAGFRWATVPFIFITLIIAAYAFLGIRWSAEKEYDIAQQELQHITKDGLSVPDAKKIMRENRSLRQMPSRGHRISKRDAALAYEQGNASIRFSW